MSTPPASTATILIVDDEPGIRTFMGRVLSKAGYAVTSAEGGAEALDLFQPPKRFDLLVTNLRMPKMRGDELVRHVRETDPGVKVLYVTAFRDLLFEGQGLLMDDDAFLDKPFTTDGLLEGVSLVLFGHLNLQLLAPKAPPPAAAPRDPQAASRLRLFGQEFQVVEWSGGSAVLTAPVALAAGSDHDCVLLSGSEVTRVSIRVLRSDVAAVSAGQIVYRTVVNVLSDRPAD